jgi:hypothetical protein
LSGISTYLLKLGPDNLGSDADFIDRSIAGSFPALTARIRLQDMARLLADGLVISLAVKPHRPVRLINIAGGPAAESWNALICLCREHSSLLTRREIVIAVLDIDEEGPAFGARALAALRGPGAPLAGIEIAFRYIRYDWAEALRLPDGLRDLRPSDAACAISSEGGLFEYGSDAEIIANLEKLHFATARDASVVGSVTRDGEPVRSFQTANVPAGRPRTVEAFGSLAERAGWMLAHVIERPFSYNIRLVKR